MNFTVEHLGRGIHITLVSTAVCVLIKALVLLLDQLVKADIVSSLVLRDRIHPRGTRQLPLLRRECVQTLFLGVITVILSTVSEVWRPLLSNL